MSYQASQWAKKQRVGDSSAKAVLKTYAHWAAEDYSSWVTNGEIMEDTEFSEQTIRKARERLVALGYLVDTGRRKGETRGIVVYQLLAPAGSVIVQSVDQRTQETISLSPPSLAEYEIRCQQKRGARGSNGKGVAKTEPLQIHNPYKSNTPTDFTSNPYKSTVEPLQISLQTPTKLTGNKGLDRYEVNGEGRDAGASRPPTSQQKGTRLPKDWTLTPELLDWALHEQPTWTAEHALRESAQFRDYWTAMAGAKGLKSDWDATWRTWVRRAGPMKASASASPSPMIENWWSTATGWERRGNDLGIDRGRDEAHPLYKVRVARAAGRGPWIDQVLKEAEKVSAEWYRQVIGYLGDDLLPADFHA